MSLRHGIQCAAIAALATLTVLAAGVRAQESSQPGVIKNPAPKEFVKLPGIPDCITVAVQHGDPGKGPSTLAIKGTAACSIPWHWHTPNEQVIVASGTARLQMKDGKPVVLRPGGFAYAPSHHVHQFTCVGPCLAYVLSDTVFDIHYVDAGGDEVPPNQALHASAKPKATK